METRSIFTDLDIKLESEEEQLKRALIAMSPLIGVIITIVFEFISPLELEFVYLLFSFISGVILYTIVREVVPEKEKGNITHFLIGVIGFSLLVLILGYTLLGDI